MPGPAARASQSPGGQWTIAVGEWLLPRATLRAERSALRTRTRLFPARPAGAIRSRKVVVGRCTVGDPRKRNCSAWAAGGEASRVTGALTDREERRGAGD